MEIIRDHSQRKISLSHRQYILDMLKKHVHLITDMCPKSKAEEVEMSKVPYSKSVCALMYFATFTRPDIAYTVSQLARFNANPGPEHWKAVKHLFRYLKATVDFKLTYGPDPSCKESFSVFTDADYGGDKDTGSSTGAYLVKIGTGAVDWSSKLQSLVTLSSTEAEFIAAVEAGKEIARMRNLLTEMEYCVTNQPTTLHIDNCSAIAVAKNREHIGRLKHLDLRFHWLCDASQSGMSAPNFCPTADMPADLLTKPLAKVKVEQFRSMMGLEVSRGDMQETVSCMSHGHSFHHYP